MIESIILLGIIAVLYMGWYLLEKLTEVKCDKCGCKKYEIGKWSHFFISDVMIEGYYDNRKCVKCGHTWIEFAESGVEVSLGG